MPEESVQQWLGRNRPPRVQITYDLEKGGATEKVELPLVVGIIADLGDPDRKETKDDLKRAKFVEVDQDNFTDVMKAIAPKLAIKGIAKPIEFKSLDDFTPDQLVLNVDELNAKYKLRQHLMNLIGTIDSNQELDKQIWDVTQKQLSAPPPPPPPDPNNPPPPPPDPNNPPPPAQT